MDFKLLRTRSLIRIVRVVTYDSVIVSEASGFFLICNCIQIARVPGTYESIILSEFVIVSGFG